MKNLRKLRSSSKISQQKLADLVGVSQPQIHSYETGEYEPDSTTLKNIANVFDTSVDYLIGNTEYPHRIERIEKFELNESESLLVEGFRKLPPSLKKSIVDMIDAFLNESK